MTVDTGFTCATCTRPRLAALLKSAPAVAEDADDDTAIEEPDCRPLQEM